MSAEIQKGKKLILSMVSAVVLLQLVSVSILWLTGSIGDTERNVGLLRTLFPIILLGGIYLGNNNARIFLGLILLMSGVQTYGQLKSIETMTPPLWLYAMVAVIFSLVGLTVISAQSIDLFVKDQKAKRVSKKNDKQM